MKRILSVVLVVVAVTIGLAAPAPAAAPVRTSLPACSTTGVIKSEKVKSDPTATGRAPVHASPVSCKSVFRLHVPTSATQGGHSLSADPIAYCSSTVTLYWYFLDYYYGYVWATGHFDCGGYVPYYMAIEVAVLNDHPDLPDVVNYKEGYGVDHLDHQTDISVFYCGVGYAGASRGAVKISPTDPGSLFPLAATNDDPFC